MARVRGPGDKKRSSQQFNNDVTNRTVTTRTRNRIIENKTEIGRINNNDYADVIGADNNDFKGVQLGTTEKTKSNIRVYPNILHQFASYTTLFTLSGVREDELRTHSFLDNTPHDIIARTGGISDANVSDKPVDTQEVGDNDETGGPMERTINRQKFNARYDDSIYILKSAHDLFIENVNMISTASPNSERNLGNFTRMEFEVHEPFGMTLIEKIRAATALSGYNDYQDAPLLLTIEFRGIDEQGQPYKVAAVRKIPILITRIEFDVNEGGSKYTVLAVPYSDLAYDDRFKFPRTNIPVNSTDPLVWAAAVEEALAGGMQDEIDETPPMREIPDVYEFNIAQAVIDKGQKYKNQTSTIHNSADVRGRLKHRGKGAKVEYMNSSATDGIALTKYFEDAIRNSYGYQKLAENFWVAYLRSAGVSEDRLKTEESVTGIVRSEEIKDILLQNSYVDWFKIKTSVETDTSRIDNITKMHPKKIIYQAVPYKIHVLKLIGPGIGFKDVDFSKAVHKEYNYIYTGDNIDVQNLRINYKTAYYMRSVRNEADSNAKKGIFTHIEETFRSVFGKERDPEPLLPLRQYPSTIRGKSSVKTQSAESNKAQEFYDYLTNPEADMLRIEMDILGDPAYICQDTYSPIHSNRVRTVGGNGQTFDIMRQSFNVDQFMPMISVKYRLPNDIDELEGTSFSAKNKYRDENLFFSGIYQVNKIESRFNNGQFTQTLFCNRMNNQSSDTTDAELQNSATKGTNNIKNFDLEDAAKKKAEKEWRKIKSQNFGLGAFD